MRAEAERWRVVVVSPCLEELLRVSGAEFKRARTSYYLRLTDQELSGASNLVIVPRSLAWPVASRHDGAMAVLAYALGHPYLRNLKPWRVERGEGDSVL